MSYSINEKNSEQINQLIEKTLQQHRIKTILDFTCGTGSQVFWLAKRGYEILELISSAKMLKITKCKAKQENLRLKFLKGDMRTISAGQFYAVLTAFNATGHLTKADFDKAMRNIHNNLKDGGLYLFDIFNLHYLLEGNNTTKLTIVGKKLLSPGSKRQKHRNKKVTRRAYRQKGALKNNFTSQSCLRESYLTQIKRH